MSIPVVINNRNRLTYLKLLIDWLLNANARIIILDNSSSYPPLLEYYNNLPDSVEVVYLGRNIGHKALYEWRGYKFFDTEYFVYTDSDIVPSDECPKDLLSYLVEKKREYPYCVKIGLALRIDDLPDHYELKSEVIKWERKWWKKKRGDLWVADVDSTFAVYHQSVVSHSLSPSMRTNFPYVARHLPWYLDLKNLSEEEAYYHAHADAKFINIHNQEVKVGMWTQKNKRRTTKLQ